MVKPAAHDVRTTNFVILVIAMVVMIGILGVLLYSILAHANVVEPDARRYLTGLACLVAGVLLFTVLLLTLRVVRYMAGCLKEPSEPFKPTEYESAWTEAGRRLKPEDAPPIEGFEDQEDEL